MPPPLLHLTSEPLALEPLVRAVAAPAPPGPSQVPSAGAVVTFAGLVRDANLGRRVHRLVYEAYEPLALRVFERIDAEVHERWPSVRLALHHRIGTLQAGEMSVAIVAASAHRADAFMACRYTIERVKQIAPIWKREYFEGGDAWVEGAVADPDDDAARQDALRRACA
jgi:molybdopterin synthase catalytic subunit